MDFSNTEKLDILLKDSFNVPSTNENIAWYLETNADYSTWTNGSDILLDTFATSNVWATSTNLSSTKMNELYGLSTSDFASGGGVLESADGFLHKFVKNTYCVNPKLGTFLNLYNARYPFSVDIIWLCKG